MKQLCFILIKPFMTMNAPTIEITTRDEAMRRLAETRYGAGAEPISRPTLWRWCKACGLPSGLSAFRPDEMQRLHRVAELLAQSFTLSHVKQCFED
jgi:hypothetical protein